MMGKKKKRNKLVNSSTSFYGSVNWNSLVIVFWAFKTELFLLKIRNERK